MTEHDGIPSVDDAVLASSTTQAEPTDNEGGSGAPATPPQDGGREGRVPHLIRQKHAADAVAARSAAEAAAMRERCQNPGRPQDYRAPEDYTRAVAEHAVREVGADMLTRQAAQAQESRPGRRKMPGPRPRPSSARRCRISTLSLTTRILSVTPIMADAIRESSRGCGDRLLPRQKSSRSREDRGLAAGIAGHRNCPSRRPAQL